MPLPDADLMGTSEVAAYLRIGRQRVLAIAKHADFPQPLAVLRMGNVWRGDDVRRWGKNRIRDAAPE